MKRGAYLNNSHDDSRWKDIDENFSNVKEFSLANSIWSFSSGLGSVGAVNYFIDGRYFVGTGFSAAAVFCGYISILSRKLVIKNAGESSVKGFSNLEDYNVLREKSLIGCIEKEQEARIAKVIPISYARKRR